MGVMTCPHCEESIDSATRTGDRKYSCGSCNMVVKYDDIQPHLDELEVDDQRTPDTSSNNDSSNDTNGGSDNTTNSKESQQQQQQQSVDESGGSPALNEREKIYQRGTDGLREIKKERLKNWLAQTEGVGAQTEQRITMVFDRNDSVHTNPHVLYNLLDDEVGASASYLNTMVEDIFAPEEEHAELLQSQGYTPWSMRSGQNAQMQRNQGQGGPMNATGANTFSPGQQQQQGGQQAQQQGGQQAQQQQGQEQSRGGGSDGISREEAQMMMQQAVNQADGEQQRNQLLSGLSDATDEALQEMASNVGGLAGTVQRVIDTALVQYAEENPEWVIENIDILQSVMGTADEADGVPGQGDEPKSEENAKVDNALQNIGGNDSDGQNPSRNNTTETNSEQTSTQSVSTDNTTPDTPDHNTENQSKKSTGSGNTQSQNDPMSAAPDEVDPDPDEPNPDLDDDLLGESEFEPDFDTKNFGADAEEQETETEPEPENTETQADTHETQTDDTTEEDSGTEQETSGEGFDDIFGDITE